MSPRIHLLHENPDWLPPFAEAFAARGLPWAEWRIDEGEVDFGQAPPEGVFYSRISASSHTRGHRHAPDYTGALLAWLQRHGRRVINGLSALDLEVSKVRQYAGLEGAGLAVPRTVAVVGGRERILAAARRAFGEGPVILKPNRGGKGLGVQLFANPDALAAHLASPDFEAQAPVDGVHLLQAYVQAPRPVITRSEFVGGRFLYAVEVDTSGGFELCPADACEVGDAPVPKFRVIGEGIEPALQASYEAFLASSGIEIAGIESIRDKDGRVWTYDVNTNTNYNPDAERAAGRSGPLAIADFLGRELRERYRIPALAAE